MEYGLGEIAVVVLLITLMCLVPYLLHRLLKTSSDIQLLSELIRILVRTGRVPPGAKFSQSSIDAIWRKVLAFYGGVTRNIKVKNEADVVITHAIDLLKRDRDSGHVLKTLADVLLKATAPDSLFVSIAEKSNQGSQWYVNVVSGISANRLEDPLTLAIESLPIEVDRKYIYTSSVNGSEFDFEGLGVGLSVFVPIFDKADVTKVVWIGFKNAVGLLNENRRSMIELIIDHAFMVYESALATEKTLETSNVQKEKILSLSHDLKSPSIRALYALREFKNSSKHENEENDLLLQEVEYALEEQLGLISELFNAGGSEVTTQESLLPVEFDVYSMIQARIESFSIIARSVSLDLRNASEGRAKIKMPKLVFNRVLDNLLSNAIKYTSSGAVTVSTKLLSQKVEISVQDTGGGVQDDLVPHLFNNSMKTQKRMTNSGHGYGLVVSKKLIEDWGGVMGYRKSENGGSEFFFTLPTVSSVKRVFSSTHIPTVLLVDDDVTVSKIHARWIQSYGCKVVVVSSFSEALSMLEITQARLIISDINIPGENFYNFVSKLPQYIPILLVTAENAESLSQTVISFSNVKGVIEKPLQKETLISSIEDLLSNESRLEYNEKAA